MIDQAREFLDAAREYGIHIADPENIQETGEAVKRLHMEGDRRGESSVTYKFNVQPDGFAVGWMSVWKMGGELFKWHSKPQRGRTKEQREQAEAWHKANREAARQQAERDKAEALVRIRSAWDGAWECKGHGYLERKGLSACGGVRVWEDQLWVPAMRGGLVMGYQRIWEDGTKKFAPGSETKDVHFDIAGDAGTVAICEGFATGLRINALMGWQVRVGFTAGQLVAAAVSARADFPDARILVCGDNDQWTFENRKKPEGVEAREVAGDDPRWTVWREEGRCVNPGRDAMMQAAGRVGAQACLPPIPGDHVGKGTDWDDYAREWGSDAAYQALGGIPVIEQSRDEYGPYYDDEPVGVSYEDASALDRIKPLGHDRGTFFFFPKATGQIMEYSATALAQPANLYAMADRSFWESQYQEGKMSSRQIADIAAGDLMRECRKKGIFNPDNSRGVGVWRDGKDIVVNTGEEVVVVGGGRFKPQDYKGKAVYEAGPLVYDLGYEPLRNREAAEIRDTAKRFNWRQSIMGDLLAGFVVLAPIGGVLKWRPHVVVTGEKGAGKSTALDNFIKVLIGEPGIYLDGGTTEAGMRKEIGLGSQPVVMDEGESETKKSRESMEGIFFLARRSSSGSKSATAMGRVNVRSCFCVAAINPRIVQGPDKDRWSTLELVKDTREGREDRWRSLELDIRRVATEEASKRLLARTVDNLPTLLANIDVFRVAASKALGDARAGDQIGPLIAGAFSLVSTKKVDEAFAAEWIAKQDWQWRDADVDVPEHEKFLATVLTMRLRYDKDGMGRESDIGAMIEAASRRDSMIHSESVDGLKQIGVKVDNGRIVFSNNSPKLAAMLKDTVWSEWRRLLMKFEGADNCGNRTIRFGKGISGKAVSIPLYHAMGDGEEELPISADDMEGF